MMYKQFGNVPVSFAMSVHLYACLNACAGQSFMKLYSGGAERNLTEHSIFFFQIA